MSIDQDIELARRMAQLSWDRGRFFAWFLWSGALLGWRIARATGWAK
jgi:hypothetical protein